MVLLFVLVPSCLQYPAVQADSIETRVLRNHTNERLGGFFEFDRFVVFSNRGNRCTLQHVEDIGSFHKYTEGVDTIDQRRFLI